MSTLNIIILIVLVSIFSILPGISFAMEGEGKPIRGFLIGALIAPTVVGWASLTGFILVSLPISVSTNPAYFFLIVMGMAVAAPLVIVGMVWLIELTSKQ